MKKRVKRRLKRSEAIQKCWQRGFLKYLLYNYQVILYETLWNAISNPQCLKFYLNCARRFGKSTVLCLIAIEYCLRHPESQIRFGSATAKSLRKITQPIFRMLLKDCPKELRPKWNSMDGCWTFPNGSQVHISGINGGDCENLRGTTSHLNLVDESGFCDELDYVIKSILVPQTLTTGGTTIAASTPPTTPAHDSFELFKECELQGNTKTYTIYNNESLTPELIALYAKESGGVDSTTFLREYMCLFATDDKSQIIPEWDSKYAQVIQPTDLTQYYHRYDSMDLGVKDLTAIIYGHYIFDKAILYIEDEDTLNGELLTTQLLKDTVTNTELKLWGKVKPFRRISDNNNLMLINDLNHLHQMLFIPTNKDTLHAMVNEVRLFVAAGRLIVNPKCKMLLGCLEYGVWDKNHKEFARSGTYKHYDHLAALVYLIRNLDQQTNPIDVKHNMALETHYFTPDYGKKKTHEDIKRMFKLK